jgi:hypothetical protein
MDPFYFLDLSIVENEEDLELQDIYDMSPDGSWRLGQEEPLLLYEDELYQFIDFDNETKILKFINGEVTKIFSLKLVYVKN